MRGAIGLLGLCLFAVSAAAGAGPIVFTAPAPGQVLRSGEVVEVSWTGVDRDADEVELLLSLDGGRQIALRLTEQLPSRSGSYLWRVPNLSSRQAAFVLRMGVGGREIESAPSALFQIQPARSRPPEALNWRGGELWLGTEAETPKDDRLPDFGGVHFAVGLDSRPLRWTPLGERDDSVAPEGAFHFATPTSARKTRVNAPSASGPRSCPPRAQRPGPLRI